MTPSNRMTLVTGATGFLGRELCARLQREGQHVVAVGRTSQAGPWHAFVEMDLSKDSVPDSAMTGISTVYHLASKAHAVAETATEADSYRPVIVEGTRRIVECARRAGVERIVYLSSVKAMGEGNPPGQPLNALNEESPRKPESPYGLAKAEAEAIIRESGIPHYVILRPVMVFGPGEKGNLPRMVEAVRRSRFPPLPDTANKRSMIHVEDVVEFAIRAATRAEAAGETFILAHPDALSTRELYDAIRDSLGMSRQDWAIPLSFLKAAAAIGSLLGNISGQRMPLDNETLGKLIGSAWYSGAKAQERLGHAPMHSVISWLKNMAD